MLPEKNMTQFYILPSGNVFDFDDILEMHHALATEFDHARISIQCKSRPPVVARDAKGLSVLMPVAKTVNEEDEDFNAFLGWMLSHHLLDE